MIIAEFPYPTSTTVPSDFPCASSLGLVRLIPSPPVLGQNPADPRGFSPGLGWIPACLICVFAWTRSGPNPSETAWKSPGNDPRVPPRGNKPSHETLRDLSSLSPRPSLLSAPAAPVPEQIATARSSFPFFSPFQLLALHGRGTSSAATQTAMEPSRNPSWTSTNPPAASRRRRGGRRRQDLQTDGVSVGLREVRRCQLCGWRHGWLHPE